MVEPLGRSDKEPVAGSSGKTSEGIKQKRAYSSARRELTEDELKSPAVHCFLLDEIDRLDKEVFELKEYKERFHAVDKGKAVLEEKIKKPVFADIIFGLCLTVGAALLGLLPYFYEIKQPSTGIILGFVGIVLIIGGIIAKTVLR